MCGGFQFLDANTCSAASDTRLALALWVARTSDSIAALRASASISRSFSKATISRCAPSTLLPISAFAWAINPAIWRCQVITVTR
ncbi:hypothetical protein B1987_19820 [Mycobacterium kansasii]|nr:hypothetical protein B1987_19820 [Mycobacterium kansasii]